MTTLQLHMFNGLYFAFLVVVAFLTRADREAHRGPGRRGGLRRRRPGDHCRGRKSGMVAHGHHLGALLPDAHVHRVRRFVRAGLPFDLRVARRFGWRGLAVFTVVAAVIGPPRDEWYMARFPEWGALRLIAPVLAIAATYAVMALLGHLVTCLVAGPARGSPLARRPWDAAE